MSEERDLEFDDARLKLAGGPLQLDGVVHYDLKASLGGREISLEELRALAAATPAAGATRRRVARAQPQGACPRPGPGVVGAPQPGPPGHDRAGRRPGGVDRRARRRDGRGRVRRRSGGAGGAAARPGPAPSAEAADVVILDGGAADELGKRGLARADSKIDLARSLIGMVVRAGAAKPDIGSVEALRSTLLAAKSIAYSDSGSGTYLSTTLFPKLGIADEVAGKSRKVRGPHPVSRWPPSLRVARRRSAFNRSAS